MHLFQALFTKGKLNCPKCNGRLGAFDFVARRRCHCGQHLVPVIHIARNRVDLVCTRVTLTEKRPDIACCNCVHGHDTQSIQCLALSDDSELMEVHGTRSEEVSGNSGRLQPVSCGLTAHVQCGNICIKHFSHTPRNAKSTVTDQSNRSLPAVTSGHNNRSLPAVRDHVNRSLPVLRNPNNRSLPTSTLRGHNSQTLPASTMKDCNNESLDELGKERTIQTTEVEDTDGRCGDDNQFSILASQDNDTDIVTISQNTQVSTDALFYS